MTRHRPSTEGLQPTVAIRLEPDLPPSVWHLVGLGAQASAIVMLAVSSLCIDEFHQGIGSVLGSSAALTVLAVIIGRSRGWQDRRPLLLFWPFAVCVTVAAVGGVAISAAQPVPGIITLCFAYVGLGLPPGRAWRLLIVAVPAIILIEEMHPLEALARVPPTVLMWLVIAEVPARLLAQLRSQRTELARLAETDALTGLLNRTRLPAHLAHIGAESSVVLIDLDRFKLYNDVHGHPAGDVLLNDFARVLQQCTTPESAVFRYGGEEFLLVLTCTSPEDALSVVAAITTAWDAHPSGTTFSAGIAAGDEDALRRADERMYAAKRLH